MKQEFIKGNEAVVKGAIIAGCRHFFGYPITPASEVAQAAALYMPPIGGTFLQAESEIAAINMVYGAASTGARSMTASSGLGISLKQEGFSYMAGSELPCLVVDVMRAGPGLGNIWPEQGDYNQIVKGGGSGNYKNLVLAPNGPQEMCDFAILGFDLAEKYRMLVTIFTDAYVGQMMEPVIFPDKTEKVTRKDWALYGDKESRKNLIRSIFLDVEAQEKHNIMLQKKYADVEKNEQRYEEYFMDDAEIVLMGYGIVARIIHTALEKLRKDGIKAGMIRPITLFPFPKKVIEKAIPKTKKFMVVELSNGQMVDDVKLTVNGRKEVLFHGRMGGAVPTEDEIVEFVTENI